MCGTKKSSLNTLFQVEEETKMKNKAGRLDEKET